MKDYIKPTFVTANIFPVALAGNACTVGKKELEAVCEIFGITEWDKAFAVGDGCKVEYPVTGYCKYNLADANNNLGVIIGS